jgi:hypothetical protein
MVKKLMRSVRIFAVFLVVLGHADAHTAVSEPPATCNWTAAADCNMKYYKCVSEEFKGISHMSIQGKSPVCECAQTWVACASLAGGSSCSKMLSIVYSSLRFCSG